MSSDALARPSNPDDPIAGMAHTGAVAARRRGWPRLAKWLAGGGVIGLIWLLHQPTTRATFPTAGQIDVLSYTRHTSIVYDAQQGHTTRDEMLRLKYYARVRGYPRAVREAELIAPSLFAPADSLGLRLVRIEHSEPVLWRSFPLAVRSWTVDFRKERSGVWRRVGE
jgi:hypothetical protein